MTEKLKANWKTIAAFVAGMVLGVLMCHFGTDMPVM